MTSPQENPVGYLLEFTVRYGGKCPTYTELAAVGPEHSKIFKTQCEFIDYKFSASATTKKAAKTAAARRMVAKLKEENFFDKYEPGLREPAEQLTVSSNSGPNTNGGGDEENKPAVHWLQDSVVQVEPSLVDPEMNALEAAAEQLTVSSNSGAKHQRRGRGKQTGYALAAILRCSSGAQATAESFAARRVARDAEQAGVSDDEQPCNPAAEDDLPRDATPRLSTPRPQQSQLPVRRKHIAAPASDSTVS